MDNHNESFGAWIAAFFCVVLFFALLVVSANLTVQNNQLKAQIAGLEVQSGYLGPSAQEIADLIVVPGVEVPEFKSDEKVSEVWDKLYESEVLFLEAKALEVALAELVEQEEDELLDFLEDNIEGFDELVSLVEDDDDREVKVLNLGLDDEEDKEMEVLLEFRFKYNLKEGEDDDFKDRLYVKSLVSYDEDDGYEAELVYSL